MTHKPCRFLGEKHRAFRAKAFLFPLVFLQESHHSLSFFSNEFPAYAFPAALRSTPPRARIRTYSPTGRRVRLGMARQTGHAIPRREILIEEKIQAMVNFVKIGHFSRE